MTLTDSYIYFNKVKMVSNQKSQNALNKKAFLTPSERNLKRIDSKLILPLKYKAPKKNFAPLVKNFTGQY